MSSSLASYAAQFVYLGAVITLFLVGLVLAITRKRYHPRSANLAFWGFLILIVETIFFAMLRNWLIYDRNRSGISTVSLSLLFTVMSVFQAIIFVLGMSLVTAAVFVGRADPRPRYREPLPELPPDRPPPVISDDGPRDTSFREGR